MTASTILGISFFFPFSSLLSASSSMESKCIFKLYSGILSTIANPLLPPFCSPCHCLDHSADGVHHDEGRSFHLARTQRHLTHSPLVPAVDWSHFSFPQTVAFSPTVLACAATVTWRTSGVGSWGDRQPGIAKTTEFHFNGVRTLISSFHKSWTGI